MDEPLVYIIVLNYNGYSDTIECINSLEKINYTNYKITIVDNNSLDNSEEILKSKFPQHFFIQTGKNLGYAGGNNIGIKFALLHKAEYIMILNNDTIVKSTFLSELLKCANKKTVVTTKTYFYKDKNKIWDAGAYVDWQSGVIQNYGCNQSDKGIFDNNRYIKYITGCCFLVHRNVIKKVGLLSEEYFLYLEDTDYSENLSQNNINMMYCAKAIIWHNESSSTKRSGIKDYYMARSRFIFFYKFRHKCSSKIWINAFFEYLGQILVCNNTVRCVIIKNIKNSLLKLI